MPSGAPIVRQGSLTVALPSLLVLAGAMVAGWLLGGQNGMVVAIGCYLGYSVTARLVVAREHRRGIRLVRRGLLAEAIPHFERSFSFFDHHRWLDDWRGLVLLSSSRASYREMALLNRAFCLGQMGEGVKASDAYRRCLELFPESVMANAALRMIEAARSGN